MTKQTLRNFALELSLSALALIPSTSLAQAQLASRLPAKRLASAATQAASHQTTHLAKATGSPSSSSSSSSSLSYTYTLLSFPGSLDTSAEGINLGATTPKMEIVGAANEGGFLAKVSEKKTVTETY
jgi:hypothetical protein